MSRYWRLRAVVARLSNDGISRLLQGLYSRRSDWPDDGDTIINACNAVRRARG